MKLLYFFYSIAIAGLSLSLSTPCLAMMEAHFADNAWNGEQIPDGQQCSAQGGVGATPKLAISGIPDETSEITLAFNDESFPLMGNGGHGVLGFEAKTKRFLILQSVPGETNELPNGVRSISPHRATTTVYSPGTAYLPPCSGGMGNKYSVTITAIKHADGGGAYLLDQIKMPLGRY
ncbi:MAG: hypothetical protein NZ807_05865 [Dehalococcoidia bacterium]|nr:hypothetical protein [Dehalococcoidia bacterium]